jgi:glycerol kinase
MPKYIGAIDQGTTSTRFMIFDETGKHITSHYLEFNQIYPRPGSV